MGHDGPHMSAQLPTGRTATRNALILPFGHAFGRIKLMTARRDLNATPVCCLFVIGRSESFALLPHVNLPPPTLKITADAAATDRKEIEGGMSGA
jgi:hypothetical protein